MKIKAWRIHEYGGPDVLRLDTVDLPEPSAGEVRVRIKAGGLNRSDLLWMTAGFFKPVLPSLIGAEICGVVDKVGKEVTAFAVGDRVSNLPIYTKGAANAYSHFGEYANIPVQELIRTPANLSDEEGAAFLYTNLTQVCALVEVAHLKPGQTVLVTAGSSANGMSAIILARKLGARVIATTRTSNKRDMLLGAGADHVVVTGEESLAARVAEITSGRGADVVYDCVGGALTNEIVSAIATNGKWIMYGFLDPSPVTINWPMWFMRQPSLHVFSLIQFAGSNELGLLGKPIEFNEAVNTVVSLCCSGELAVPVAQTFQGIESVQTAFRAMEANIGGGKIVVRF